MDIVKKEYTDQDFYRENADQFIIWKGKDKGLPVGRWLIVAGGLNGYSVYNRKLKSSILDREFDSLQMAYWFAKMLEQVYVTPTEDYLEIITLKEWEPVFFGVVANTIDEVSPGYGTKVWVGIERLRSRVGLIYGNELGQAFR